MGVLSPLGLFQRTLLTGSLCSCLERGAMLRDFLFLLRAPLRLFSSLSMVASCSCKEVWMALEELGCSTTLLISLSMTSNLLWIMGYRHSQYEIRTSWISLSDLERISLILFLVLVGELTGSGSYFLSSCIPFGINPHLWWSQKRQKWWSVQICFCLR